MLSSLNKKVEDVYRSCIGDNEANIRSVGALRDCHPNTHTDSLLYNAEQSVYVMYKLGFHKLEYMSLYKQAKMLHDLKLQSVQNSNLYTMYTLCW